jgi:carnitine 3-dehydrogenase
VNIAVLGSGTIGQSWCALFLAAGHSVVAYDPNPMMEERIVAFIAASNSALKSLGYQTAGSFERFRFSQSAADAVLDAEFIQENAPEKIAVKHQLFGEIESYLEPNAVILSSTSGITLEKLQSGLRDPSRIVIAHPFNPPHLIPLVELLGNYETDPLVIERVRKFYESLRKVPVELKRSVPGHVANRIQAVVWQEALHLAQEGVASLSDIDKAIANGPGIRWSIYGPNQLFSLAAGDQGLEGFIEHLGPSFQTWWSSAGRVEFNSETMDMVRNQFSQNDQDLDAMKIYRDELLVKILKAKIAMEDRGKQSQ